MINTIPKVQRAYILPDIGTPLKLVDDHPVASPEALLPGQCLVRLSHSGVCHSDLAIKEGWFASRRPPKSDLIGGHEGIGTVVAVGAQTRNGSVRVGDRVGVMYMGDTCQTCELCLSGSECCKSSIILLSSIRHSELTFRLYCDEKKWVYCGRNVLRVHCRIRGSRYAHSRYFEQRGRSSNHVCGQ